MENRSLNILLIEDNPADVRLIEEYLKETSINFKLTVTQRISDATKIVKNDKSNNLTSDNLISNNLDSNNLDSNNDFDLILTDLGLPDSSGLDTLKQLKETGTNIPIVVLTGLNNEEIALISLKEGAQDYLVKNILNSKNLSRSIKFTLERKKIEDKKSLLISVLHSLTSRNPLGNIVKDIINNIKEYTKFDIVTLKLNETDDYQHQINYSFLTGKNKLAEPYFTGGGSFWTTDGEKITSKLAEEGKEDFLTLISFKEGYGSYALIPIRSGDKIIGLLELADKQTGSFNKELIEFYEGLAKSIGTGIVRIKAEESMIPKKVK